MKLRLIFIVALNCFFIFKTSVNAQNILSKDLNLETLEGLLLSKDQFKPYPPKTDRKVWDEIAPEVKQHFIDKASNLQNFEWRGLPATVMLEFVRTGNRTNYENISFSKRSALMDFALAELVENKGRFVDNIVDGVWSICEESYWGLPAHLKHAEAGEGLVDNNAPFVDLFSAETARILALVNYFFKDDFQRISPEISKRINSEIQQRVLQPVLNSNLFWMNVSNNWNTWISASWLTTALLEETNPQNRSRAVYKIMGGLDNFLKNYPDDGGCDEGPAYWNAAGGSLYECLYMIDKATDKKITFWQNNKIRQIGEYITKVRLTENYITNFADAPAKSSFASSWVYFCGEMIQNNPMMAYGVGGIFNDLNQKSIMSFCHFNRTLELVLNFEKLKKIPPQKPFYKDIWLERIQVMVARDTENTDKGFVLAAKGGSNYESHNHNDVGSFMVYYNGFPVLIDVGNGTYTARTFSKDRYTLWSNASDYHNLPTVNGITQKPGIGTNATSVVYQKSRDFTSFSSVLNNAYPENAGIQILKRNIVLQRMKYIELQDYISTKQEVEFTENFMTCSLPDIDQKGKIYLKAGEKRICILYNPKQLVASFEKIKLDLPEDTLIKEAWNDIYRVQLKTISLIKKTSVKIIIMPVL